MLQMFGTGHVGRDPEMKYTPSGTAITQFSVACKVGRGEYEKTQWLRLKCFGKLAEIVNQYVMKGNLISFIGEPDPDKDTGNPHIWTDKSGNPQTNLEIVVREIKFSGGSGSKAESDMEF